MRRGAMPPYPAKVAWPLYCASFTLWFRLLLGAAPVCAWSTYLDEPAAWTSVVPYSVRLPVGTHVDPAFRDQLARAVERWTGLACADLRVEDRGITRRLPDVSLEGADGFSVIGFEEREWPHGESVAAVTRLRIAAGAIVEADLLINAVDFEWRAGDVPATSRRLRSLQPMLVH